MEMDEYNYYYHFPIVMLLPLSMKIANENSNGAVASKIKGIILCFPVNPPKTL